MTHSVWEARQIGLAAAKHQVVTQMGTQGRSGVGEKLTVELLRRKPLGRIRQIHLWTDRPIWPQGLERPPAQAIPEEKYSDYPYPQVEGDNHYLQWTRACLDPSRKTLCPFDTQSGPLTEAILLGNIALRFPGRALKWDAASFSFPGAPEADGHLWRSYRNGWEIEGLG